MKKNKTVKYLFRGFVQGVGFRSFCHYIANKYDISGSVKNLPNGNVEVFAMGSLINLSLFFERIKNGPPGSNIEEVVTEEQNMDLSGKGFKIL